MRVTIGAFHWPHHAGHSGYDRLVPALDGLVDLDVLAPGAAAPVPAAVVRRVAERSGMDYTRRTAAFEIAAVRRLWLRRTDVCHFLEAEYSYRYTATLTPARRGAVVCTCHNPRWVLDMVLPDRRPLARLDALIVMSRSQMTELADVIDADRMHFVPHGVDTAFYSPGPGPAGGERRAIFVGSHMRDRETFVEVAQAVGRADPSIRFEAITSPGWLEELNALPNVAATSGVGDHELLAAYRRADLLVMPLQDSTANNALLEAMSCGLPVLTTDIGGVRDYVDADGAALFAPGDAAGMAEAVVALMDNPERRATMAAANRRRALDLDWQHVARAHVEVYEEALRRRGGRR